MVCLLEERARRIAPLDALRTRLDHDQLERFIEMDLRVSRIVAQGFNPFGVGTTHLNSQPV